LDDEPTQKWRPKLDRGWHDAVEKTRHFSGNLCSQKIATMPRSTQTATAKAVEDERKIRLALAAVVGSGFNNRGQPCLSIRAAAEQYGVSRSRLTARYNGRKTRIEAHAGQQKLSPPQEHVLSNWIRVVGERGIPVSLGTLAAYASTILAEPLSESWALRFRARHPELKARWSTGLECCRARALNRTHVTGFFDILTEVIAKYNIVPENIYNMDEKGIQMGVGKRTLVLVDRDQKTVQQLENGNRELVTVIETVCADGTALRPSVIYKGQRRDFSWGRDNPCDARCACPFSEQRSILSEQRSQHLFLTEWVDRYGARNGMAEE
jgi:hypothetical protein